MSAGDARRTGRTEPTERTERTDRTERAVRSGGAVRGAAAVGVDIGGTTTAAAVVGPDHRVRARHTAPTPAAEGPEAVLATAVRLARAALADADTGLAGGDGPGGTETAAGGTDRTGTGTGARGADGAARAGAGGCGAGTVRAVGVGTAGVVGPDGRTVRHATDALPGWAGTPVAERLESALGLPATVLGDVQAFLTGEVVAGAAAGAGCAVGVMAGTGVGGAVWAGGVLLRGTTGAAGHLGHVPVPGAEGAVCPCGATGHVEAVASGPAMVRRFRSAAPNERAAGLRDVAALAAGGHPVAREVLAAGGRALGTALGGVVGTLDPGVVVVSGGVLDSGPWYEAALREALASAVLPSLRGVRVVRAALGAGAVLVGAADAARRRSGGAS